MPSTARYARESSASFRFASRPFEVLDQRQQPCSRPHCYTNHYSLYCFAPFSTLRTDLTDIANAFPRSPATISGHEFDLLVSKRSHYPANLLLELRLDEAEIAIGNADEQRPTVGTNSVRWLKKSIECARRDDFPECLKNESPRLARWTHCSRLPGFLILNLNQKAGIYVYMSYGCLILLIARRISCSITRGCFTTYDEVFYRWLFYS